MLRCATLLLLLGVGCSTVPAQKTVAVTIRNSTAAPLTIWLGDGFFRTSLVIHPGETWSGTVPRTWPSSIGEIQIEPAIKVR